MSTHSDTPETDDIIDEFRETADLSNLEKSVADLERQRNEARTESANWKQLYTEAVERGNLFQSQRDESRAHLAAANKGAKRNAEALAISTAKLNEAREENARLREALANCREDSVELMGEREWWKHEPRCDYQERYAQTAKNLQIADALLTP